MRRGDNTSHCVEEGLFCRGGFADAGLPVFINFLLLSCPLFSSVLLLLFFFVASLLVCSLACLKLKCRCWQTQHSNSLAQAFQECESRSKQSGVKGGGIFILRKIPRNSLVFRKRGGGGGGGEREREKPCWGKIERPRTLKIFNFVPVWWGLRKVQKRRRKSSPKCTAGSCLFQALKTLQKQRLFATHGA